VLFTIERADGVPYRNRVASSAVDASSLTATTQHFVSVFVNAEKSQQVDWELLRDVFPVDLAGKHFFREDYKESSAGRTLYRAFICTKFRGYFLGWTFAAGSPSELEESVNLLQGIKFSDEAALSDNIPRDRPTGIVGGILGPASPQSQSGPPPRVRVSRRVSEALLITKVQPKYPQDARKAGIQGVVVLQSLIDTNGNVKELKIVTGDPSLTSAASDAVKQWKYKPYLLNGQPVEVDTQVIVAFQLSMR
jgi:TonB family protein